MNLLSDLKPGEEAHIVKVEQGPAQRELLEMGLVEGSTIQVLREAPLSRDPVLYWVRGTRVAIRRALAKLVHVTRDQKD